MKARRQMTSQEKQAMHKEIKRQLLKMDEEHANDVDAAILYTLHITLGFGKKRLRRFFDNFHKTMLDLETYYEMPNDSPWLCRRKLKDIGVDVAEWNEERRRNK